ncbi:MAG: 4Fe-4S binding protein [Desulfatibacillum sp.]|nr:4Fe-4S binding protein [Desulfatibacillum sp.]
MKTARLFIGLRIVISTAITLVILLALVDLWALVPPAIVRFATWFQFLPSLVRAITAFGVLATGFLFVLGLTLVFGRVYCSFLCPLGAFMDWTISLRKKFHKQKFAYKKPEILRYIILAGVGASLLSGSMILANLLDPYSIFARSGQAIVRPLVIGLNNVLAHAGEAMGYYGIAPYPWRFVSLPVFAMIAAWLALVIWMAARHGRLYCNTLCPVGGLLGIFSKISVFKISISPDNCIQCGACARVCKASCMDHEQSNVDTSRCVMCLDCLTICPAEAVVFGGRVVEKKNISAPGRRGFLAMAALFLLGMLKRATGDEAFPDLRQNPVLAPQRSTQGLTPAPPGSLGREHFMSACTACHLCVAACPSQVIVPKLIAYGGQGLMMPGLAYDKGFCNYNCNACTRVCPAGAILPVGVEEKKRIQMGQAKFVKQNCVVVTQKTECVACAEHCPTGAVKIVRDGGPGLPQVDTEVCIGCGACEFACPAKPFKAIYVEGNHTHRRALPPKKGESVQTRVGDDFPF